MRHKVAYFGVFAAMAMILSYIESLFPVFIGVPGVKLGLANSMSLVILYLLGAPAAWLIAVVRVVLTGFLFGNLFSIAYGLAGAMLSITVMILLKRFRLLSMVGISMAGGMSHNIGQIVVAIFIAENVNLVYYLPVLLISGIVTGLVIGVLSREILKRMPGNFRSGNL